MEEAITEPQAGKKKKNSVFNAMSGRWRELFVWFLIAKVFGLLMMGLVYGFTAWWGKQWTWLVFIVSAEICTVLRFLANDRLVFRHRIPTLARCWRYHVANAGSFVVYSIASIILAFWGAPQLVARFYYDILPSMGIELSLSEQSLNGIENMVAGSVAAAFSVLLSIYTNFFWIWKKNVIEPEIAPK